MSRLITLLVLLLSLQLCPYEETILKNGDYTLEALRINGHEKGKTLLIFGGIHGDEPGGHLSAELLKNIHLEKGQLIIVPRVNFPSIMLNKREIHGDMNRKFTDHSNPNDPEQPIVDKLKELMAEADIFINQHDAAGFHREKHLSELYNPHKYGQSLIVDTAELYSPRHGKTLNLESMGKEIVMQVNRQIRKPEHHFCFWNHNSLNPDTKFLEMKLSATHYAAIKYQIPAFGLETSKDLPRLEDKIRYQLLVIQEIMKAFDFRFHLEPIDIPHPLLYWVQCKNGNDEIIRVNQNTIIRLLPKDPLTIESVYANYATGLSADILGWEGLNDLGKKYLFSTPKVIHIRKNHLKIGTLYMKSPQPNSVLRLGFLHQGEKIEIPNWGVIRVRAQDSLKLLAPSPNRPLRWRLNLIAPESASTSFLLAKDPSIIDVGKLNKTHSHLGQGRIFDFRVYDRQGLVGGFQLETEQNESEEDQPPPPDQS